MDTLHQVIGWMPWKGILGGALVAVKTDFDAFRSFKSWHDAAVYDWGRASFRLIQGAVIGGMTNVTLYGIGF